MRASVTALVVLSVPAMLVLPAVGQAQSPAVTRGALARPMSTEAPTGVLRGAVPQGATVGVVRGTLPPGGTTGVIQSVPANGSTGVFRSSAVDTVPVMPGGFAPTPVPTLRGPLPIAAAVGALAPSLPPGARFAEPGPADIAKGLDEYARIYMVDGNYAQGQGILEQSVAAREVTVGRIHPEVAGALETDAQLLRHYARDAAAVDIEVRAQEIRKKLEPPAPKKPARF
jgi:hypothetical protein